MTTTTKFEKMVCTNCNKRNGKCLISKILDCGCKQLGIFCRTPNEAMRAIETAHQKQIEDIPFEPDPPKTSKLPTAANMQNVPF